MSEYQIYEFQTVDRPLTNLEREKIRQLSSRVNPTSHRAMFNIEFDEDTLEPPVPPGLQTLSPAQAAFVQTFEIDPAILAAAQQASEPLSKTPEIDWSRAIAKLPSQDQQTFLVRLAEGEPNLTAKLQKALRPFVIPSSTASTQNPRRSVKQLLELAVEEEKKAMQLAEEKAKAERIKALQKLAPKEPYLWEEVEKIMREKKGHSYGRATELLQDLKDLAIFQQQEVIFEARLHKLCESYSPTPALVKRLKQAKLL